MIALRMVLPCILLYTLSYGAVDLSKIAVATSVNGKVMVYSGRSIAKSVESGDPILVNDLIVTGAKSEITIKVEDFGVFTLKENTSVRINDMVNRSGKMKMNLSKGNMLFGVKKLMNGADAVTVETPSAVAAVRGTSFSISASPGTTKIAVLTGEVAVKSGGNEVSIPELKELTTAPNKKLEVVSINKDSFGEVKEILNIKDIASIKNVGDMAGNLKKIELVLSGDIGAGETTGKAAVTIEGTDVKANEIKKTRDLDVETDVDTKLRQKRDKDSSEEKSLLKDKKDL
ncbi:MAG: FecR domain-containing protein [Spirochaetota bacterium]